MLCISRELAAALVIWALRAAMSAAKPTLTVNRSQPSPCAIDTVISGFSPRSSARRNRVSSGISAASFGKDFSAVRTAASPFLNIW